MTSSKKEPSNREIEQMYQYYCERYGLCPKSDTYKGNFDKNLLVSPNPISEVQANVNRAILQVQRKQGNIPPPIASDSEEDSDLEFKRNSKRKKRKRLPTSHRARDVFV